MCLFLSLFSFPSSGKAAAAMGYGKDSAKHIITQTA
jgi:hypothetical protein